MLEALEKDTAVDGGMDAIKGRRLRGLRSVHESWGREGHKSEHNTLQTSKRPPRLLNDTTGSTGGKGAG